MQLVFYLSRWRAVKVVRFGARPSAARWERCGLRHDAGARSARASRFEKAGARYERLSSMAFCNIWSAVVTTLLLDWKPRCVTIMLTISDAMSTLEFSML